MSTGNEEAEQGSAERALEHTKWAAEDFRDYLQEERRRLERGFYEFDENSRLSEFEDTEEGV